MQSENKAGILSGFGPSSFSSPPNFLYHFAFCPRLNPPGAGGNAHCSGGSEPATNHREGWPVRGASNLSLDTLHPRRSARLLFDSFPGGTNRRAHLSHLQPSHHRNSSDPPTPGRPEISQTPEGRPEHSEGSALYRSFAPLRTASPPADHCQDRETPWSFISFVFSVSTFHFMLVPLGWPDTAIWPERIRLPD